MSRQIVLRSKANESVFVYNDKTAQIMSTIADSSFTYRASHVEPYNDEWTADMKPVGGPFLGPFPTRELALTAERRWLQEYRGI